MTRIGPIAADRPSEKGGLPVRIAKRRLSDGLRFSFDGEIQ